MSLVHTKFHAYTLFHVLLRENEVLEKFKTLCNVIIQQVIYIVVNPSLVRDALKGKGIYSTASYDKNSTIEKMDSHVW